MKARYPIGDYNQRLHNGVILWDGVPHRINTENDALNIADLVTGEMVARGVDPDHEHLDISSFELGYINTNSGAYYLTRMPLRQFKQSISSGSVIEYSLGNGGPMRDGMGRSRWLMTKEFRDRYTKPFPSFDKALELLDNRESVALSPNVALTRDELGTVKVWFKLESVGVIVAGTRIVRVPTSDKAWVVSMYLDGFGWEVD